MAIVQNIVAFLAVSFVSSRCCVICASTYEAEWEEFKVTHNKQYETPEQESFRKQIFMENIKKIEEHNENHSNGLESYTLGINYYSDMSYEELKQRIFTLKPEPIDPNVPVFYESGDDNLTSEVDWRKHNAVTRVKFQGVCGSCYAFSAVCALEGQLAIKHKKLVSLSEKNLADCSKPQGNDGCGGGFVVACYMYIVANKGIDTEESYPYDDTDDICRFTKEGIGATIDGYVRVNKSEKALLEAVAKIGPISVNIGTSDSFLNYKGGIYADVRCPRTADHSVAIVGYGTENGVDYWIIKNSFGVSWGEKGYMRMWRGNNLCVIQDEASYPLM